MTASHQNLHLHNCRAVLPEQVIEQASISIENGRIRSVSHDQPPAGSEVIDLQRHTVYPGFIDVHIHGAVGVDTMAATADDLARVSEFLATEGVTAWLPTLVPAPVDDYQRSIVAIDEAMKSDGGARLLGVHYEGPFVNNSQCGALHSKFFREFSRSDELTDLPRLQTPAVKHMMTLAPEISGGIDLVRELSRRNWVLSIGHTRSEFELLDQAFDAGARHMTHFMNAMSPLHHRAPGPVAWGLSRDDVSLDIIADGVHLDPKILRLLLQVKGVDNLMLISDAIAAAGKGDGEYQIWGETISVKEGRTRNQQGSIAGSVITMLDAFLTMKSLGVTETRLARLTSGNAARLLGMYDECGSIEEGKRADLIALDADGKVMLTIVGGKIVYEGRR